MIRVYREIDILCIHTQTYVHAHAHTHTHVYIYRSLDYFSCCCRARIGSVHGTYVVLRPKAPCRLSIQVAESSLLASKLPEDSLIQAYTRCNTKHFQPMMHPAHAEQEMVKKPSGNSLLQSWPYSVFRPGIVQRSDLQFDSRIWSEALLASLGYRL